MSRGGVVLADYEKTEVYIRNTTFRKNFAVDGAVFFAHFGSYIDIENCTFTENIAIQGSIGRIEN